MALTRPCRTFSGVSKGRACPWTRARTAATAGRATKEHCATCGASRRAGAGVCSVCTVSVSARRRRSAAPVRRASPDRAVTWVSTHARTHQGQDVLGGRRLTRFLSAELPCGGQPVRDYHRVQRGPALCQTAKPFSWVECRGRCQAAAATSCCAPLRVRRRRLSFECDDGTTFTQDVEKPVECGCKECV